MTIAIGDLVAKVTKAADGTFTLVTPVEWFTVTAERVQQVFTAGSA